MSDRNKDRPKVDGHLFQAFLASEERTPPRSLSNQILAEIHADLFPSPARVFSRLALIHAFVGSVTLLFCPQFGIGLFEGMGLMSLFMRYGEHACMLGCGAVFMGGSALTASLFLRPEEVKIVRKTELLQISFLGFLSLGLFACAGIDFVLGLALFWLLGSILGGLATFELGWKLRTLLSQKLGSRRI